MAGVVPLEGDGKCWLTMKHSEQLDTYITLAAIDQAAGALCCSACRKKVDDAAWMCDRLLCLLRKLTGFHRPLPPLP